MPTITLTVDERTGEQLDRLSNEEEIPTSEMALRLLRRALRARQPKQAWDGEVIRAQSALFAEEDSLIAESDQEHRAALLQAEDNAQ
jgi:hypothetical protein